MKLIVLISSLTLTLSIQAFAQDEPWLLTDKNVNSALTESFNSLKSSDGIILDLLADQITSRNKYVDYAEEPRYDTKLHDIWNLSNLIVNQLSVLDFIQAIEDENKLIEGFTESQTQSALATLYLAKGLIQGQLGLLHDSSVILDRNTDYRIEDSWGLYDIYQMFDLDLYPYQEVVESGISDMEKAISIVEEMQDNNIDYELIFFETPQEFDATSFIKMTNSLIAKLLINTPRSSDEMIDYTRILFYANAGLDESYSNILFTDSTKFDEYNILSDDYFKETNYVPSCDLTSNSDCSAKFPTDLKALFLLDENYVSSYPRDSLEYELKTKLTLVPATSNDPRLTYYKYTTKPSYLDPVRPWDNWNLHSPYFSIRNYYGQEWNSQTYPFVLMTQAELQYIKAECYFGLGNMEKANEALQNSPYGAVPTNLEIDLPSVQLGLFPKDGYAFNGPLIEESAVDFTQILHKEYSVEVSTLTTIGTHLFFMRRHNLLQMYTPKHYPADHPESTISSYGGRSDYGSTGSSSGLGAWKKNPDLQDAQFNSYYSQVGANSVLLKWNSLPTYPEPTQPLIHIYSDDINLDTTLSSKQTELFIDGLLTDSSYTFYARVSSDYRERLNYSKWNEITFTTNYFGLKKFEEHAFGINVYHDRINRIKLHNILDQPLKVDSVSITYGGDSTILYDGFYDLLTYDADGFTIDPNSNFDFDITIHSDLWAAYNMGPLIVKFYSHEVSTSFTYKIFLSDKPSGNFPIWYLHYGAQDSLSFGTVEPGQTDSIQVQIRNMSLQNIMIDSLYLADKSYVDIRNGASRGLSTNTFYFEQPDSSVTIEPFEWKSFWLYVKPESTQPESVYGFIDGSLSTDYNGIGHFYINQGERTEVGNEITDQPYSTELFQNYPNPFNPSTTIEYQLRESSQVTIHVFDLMGRNVATLVDEQQPAGQYAAHFDGRQLSSGVYFYRIEAGNFVQTKRMLLIK